MERKLKIEIAGNHYDVDYPNTGKQIDIELLKAKIADGKYDDLRFSQNVIFNHQADIIDMICTFTILIPELKKDLNVSSMFNLEEEQTEVLLSVYSKVFIPWYTAIKTAIRNPKDQTGAKTIDKENISQNREE